MTLKLLLSTLLFFTLGVTVFGQKTITGKEAHALVPNASSIILDKNQSLLQVEFRNEKSYDANQLQEVMKKLFGSREDDTWSLIRSENDEIGMTHARYQQIYKGLSVDGFVYIFHYKNNKLISANGHFLPNIKLSIDPKVSESTCIQTVLTRENLKRENIDHLQASLSIKELNGTPFLAYKVEIANHQSLLNKWIYVDAQTGKIIQEMNRTCSVDAIGTGHTQFSGIQTVTTDSISPTLFRTDESSRGNGIHTYNMNSPTMESFTDNDNDWNNVNPEQDEFAMDVHFGTEATYDFFKDNFNRNSYDNLGGVITSYVNDVSVGVNAYWSGGPTNEMHYGNGDLNFFPVASLEVAGHELSHGVTEYSAGLIYLGESGALNESFSDIFGNTIRFLRAPAYATWYIGDQLLRPGGTGDAAFRNMSNPNEFMNADTYNGLYFNNGDIVHYDSGIQNFWYYLLVSGGTGVNDIGNNYAVTAIGMTDAVKIAYRNLAYYLTPNATFMDSRLGSEQAAIDLFGLCSNQQYETIHAWYAVGVGSNFASTEVDATFSANDLFSCTAPFSTTFTANPGYENYLWDFGDGQTSTLNNPSHTYTSTGNYSVILTVSNMSICPSNDSQTNLNMIVVSPIITNAGMNVSGDLSPLGTVNFTDISTMSPTSWQWDFGDGNSSNLQNPTHEYSTIGLYSVRLIATNCAGSDTSFIDVTITPSYRLCNNSNVISNSGSLYDSGGPTGDYFDDENCFMNLISCSGTSITFNMAELNLESGYDFLSIYDGPDISAPIITQYNGTDLQGSFTSTGNTIHLRFTSDFSVTQSGFKLDYTSNGVVPSVNSIDFSSSGPAVSLIPVNFTDLSTGSIQSWFWNFGDGDFSSIPNPLHTYLTSGTYTVTLTVIFCDGTQETKTITLFVGLNGMNENLSNSLEIYPNPSSGDITLNLKESASIEIIDSFGKLIDSFNLNDGKHTISLKDQAEGMYFIHCKTANGSFVSKLILTR